MFDEEPPHSVRPQNPSGFATTHWSLVLAAGTRGTAEAESAMETLCQTYWFPVYAYVRRRVSDAHQAEDLTQEFFTQLLERETFATADRERGRFRGFLLTACRRFLANEWHAERAVKRGGGRHILSLDFPTGKSRYAIEAVEKVTPERLFEQQWALTLLARVLETLRAEFADKGRLEQFEELKPFLTGGGSVPGYDSIAGRLGMSPGAVKVAVHRLRSRYRELLRLEVAQTVSTPEEVEEEIRSLIAILAKN